MKRFIVLIFALTLSSYCCAQSNSIYAELFGNGLLGSVNYERQITPKPVLFARVGIGFWSDLGVLGSTDSGYTIPLSLNYLLDLKNNNYLDFGIGSTLVQSNFSSTDAPKNIAYLFTSIGFRRNFEGNFFWRFHITPYVNNITYNTHESGSESFIIVEEFDFNTEQWFGFSIGKRF